jgi:hypothetical protein
MLGPTLARSGRSRGVVLMLNWVTFICNPSFAGVALQIETRWDTSLLGTEPIHEQPWLAGSGDGTRAGDRKCVCDTED